MNLIKIINEHILKKRIMNDITPEVIFDSKSDAKCILDEMNNLLREYKNVTIENLKDLCGENSKYTDHKYGWTSLKGSKIRKIGSKYLLKLPRVKLL